jgi:hypothetical protein
MSVLGGEGYPGTVFLDLAVSNASPVIMGSPASCSLTADGRYLAPVAASHPLSLAAPSCASVARRIPVRSRTNHE